MIIWGSISRESTVRGYRMVSMYDLTEKQVRRYLEWADLLGLCTWAHCGELSAWSDR